jgi:hypothetical protein
VGPGYQVAPRLGARLDAPVPEHARGDGRGRALVPLEDRQTTRNRRNARRSRPASLREEPVVVEVRPLSGSASGRFDRHMGKMANLPLRAVDAAPQGQSATRSRRVRIRQRYAGRGLLAASALLLALIHEVPRSGVLRSPPRKAQNLVHLGDVLLSAALSYCRN